MGPPVSDEFDESDAPEVTDALDLFDTPNVKQAFVTCIKCNLGWAGKVLNHFQSRFAVFVAVQQLRCSTMGQYHATLVGQYHNHFLSCFGYCATLITSGSKIRQSSIHSDFNIPVVDV